MKDDENQSILRKIMDHKMQHEHHAMTVCPMIINKKELMELIGDTLMQMTLPAEQQYELLNMESGFIGILCNVPLFLWEQNNENIRTQKNPRD